MPTTVKTWLAVAVTTLVVWSLVSCNGFFVDPQIVSITVNPATPSIILGQTQQFTAVATFDDGSRKTLTSAGWNSSNPTVLTINSSGLAKAVGAGTATVTASSGTGSGSTTATVLTSALTSITVTPANQSFSKAAQPTVQYKAEGTFADGSTQDITSTVSWTSSNQGVATISNTGLATLVASGTTTITATQTSSNISGATTLTVTP